MDVPAILWIAAYFALGLTGATLQLPFNWRDVRRNSDRRDDLQIPSAVRRRPWITIVAWPLVLVGAPVIAAARAVAGSSVSVTRSAPSGSVRALEREIAALENKLGRMDDGAAH